MEGEVKTCPYCGESIAVQAILCRYCKRDLATGAPAGPPMESAGSKKSGAKVILIVLACVLGGCLVFGGIIAALIIPATVNAICQAREGATRTFVVQLHTAADMYQVDWERYPPGDGTGSKEFAAMLSRPGPKKLPYFAFHPGMLTASGDIMNPVWSEERQGGPKGIIYYRNNAQPTDGGKIRAGQPPVYNKKSVDIWCAGCKYDSAYPSSVWGVNNWE